MRQLVFRLRGPSSSTPEHGAAPFPSIYRDLISPGGSRWTNRQGRWLGKADLKNGLVLLSPHPTQAGCWCSGTVNLIGSGRDKAHEGRSHEGLCPSGHAGDRGPGLEGLGSGG